MPPSAEPGLASWFSTWNPRYRSTLIKLFLLALLAGVLVYAENAALESFTRALRLSTSHNNVQLRLGPWLERASHVAAAVGIGLPALVLLFFVALRAIRIGSSLSQRLLLGELSNRSRNDLEVEVLAHLLKKDDAFFAAKPPAEILNRLSVDINRVVDRRVLQMRQFRSVLLAGGNLYFFVGQDARLALVGLLTCGLGAWWMGRLSAPLRETDRALLATDDEVKAHFEDFLRATPEVQVGNLAGNVLRHFRKVQSDRKNRFADYQRLDARLDAASGAANLLALVSLLLVTLYFLTASNPDSSVALVPVILKALPELWTSASAIVAQRLSMQLADTSATRLLEYDTGADTASGSSVSESASSASIASLAHASGGAFVRPQAPTSIRLDTVSHRFRSSSGALQGGVVDVSTEFPPGKWVAVVGGAGAGKSTLMQLLLGRLKAQSGKVLFGEHDLGALSGPERAQLLTLMPQTVSLLDGTILENLEFGREIGRVSVGSESEQRLLERSGLAEICRGKALNLLPEPSELDVAGPPGDFGRAVLQLRARSREALRGMGLTLHPYEVGASDPHHWIVESLFRGRCDRPRTMQILFASTMKRTLAQLSSTTAGQSLVERGRMVLQKTQGLLGLPSFHVYSKLAPYPIDERIWQLRSAGLDLATRENLSGQESATLVLIALTCARAETRDSNVSDAGAVTPCQTSPTGFDTISSSIGKGTAHLTPLRTALGTSCQPFDVGRIHPFLTWRENLVYAAVEMPNSRIEQRVEQALLDLITEAGMRDELRRVGLRYPVGRAGTRLSGGQRQLVALNRALFRDTPVLVLDEPTSALDPASRGKVCELLREWKDGRIVITVSHDPELVKQADEVRVIENGRIAASGSFEELRASSTSFRGLMRIK